MHRCAAYEKGGPAAEARFEAGVAGFEARAFRGCGIMTSEPFEVSDDQDSVQMLTRNSQVGEFYVLQPPQVPPDVGKEKFTCDILIYDEESDRHVRITWAQALAACCIDSNDAGNNFKDSTAANPALVDGRKNMSHPTGSDKSLRAWYAKAKAIEKYNEQAGSTAIPYSTVDPDIRIVVARPFIEHLMHSVVMAVSGRDTGATLFGPADMQLSANTQVKTIEGHYTGHFKAVVTKPQNVLVMRDVACAGYVAGCNTLFFAQNSNGSADYNCQHATTNMMERLSFSNDVGAKYASMLAFPCTAQQFSSGHLDTVMSVTTRLLPWEVTTATGGDHRSFPGGQEIFKEYQAKLNLRSVHFGEDMKAAENQDFISQVGRRRALHAPPLLHTYAHPFARFRARPTTPRASSAPTASTTPSRSRSSTSSRARATLAPTPSRATRAGAAASRSRSRRPATRWNAAHKLQP